MRWFRVMTPDASGVCKVKSVVVQSGWLRRTNPRAHFYLAVGILVDIRGDAKAVEDFESPRDEAIGVAGDAA